MAAGQGDAEAQFNLGYMYAKGQGVPRDDVRSHMWFNLSNSQETDDDMRKGIAKALNAIEERMTQEQIREAQKLAREWKPKARF